MTAASIALGWILFRQPRRGWTKTLFIINFLFGVLGGLLGGIGVFAEIFFVFDPDALVKISWVPSRRSEALRDCIATGYCLFHPSLGPAFGGGCGLALATLHNSVGWQRFLAPHIAAGQIVEWGKTLRRTLFLSTVYSIGTVILLYASSLMFVFFKGFPLYQVLGETATIFTGNIGAVAGILLGLLIMRMGIVIPPHAD